MALVVILGVGALGFPQSQLVQEVHVSTASDCPCDCAPTGGDGLVNVSDFLALLAQWGDPALPPGTCDCAPEGGDGIVNVSDFLKILADWGDCP